MQLQIHANNTMTINAKLIVEAANDPFTHEPKEILRYRGATILSNKYINAVGVTVSNFQWTHNILHLRFGRLQRRYEELRGINYLHALEEITGREVSEKLRHEHAS